MGEEIALVVPKRTIRKWTLWAQGRNPVNFGRKDDLERCPALGEEIALVALEPWFGVSGWGFGVWGLEFGTWDVGKFGVKGFGLRVSGFGV